MSGRKNIINANHLFTETAVVADKTTNPIDVSHLDNIAVQVNWSAGASSPAATVVVKASVDGTNYVDLVLDSVPTITGNSGSVLINLNQLPFNFVKFFVDWTAGSYTLDVWVTAKQL